MPDAPVRVDATHLAELITGVRDVAETIRTYGCSRNRGTIAVQVPAALHVLAAQLESEMRSWAVTEQRVARLINGHQGAQSLRFPELRAVLSYVTPAPVSPEVQVSELRAAAVTLAGMADGLAEVMATQSTSGFTALLRLQAAMIVKFADGLEEEDGQ